MQINVELKCSSDSSQRAFISSCKAEASLSLITEQAPLILKGISSRLLGGSSAWNVAASGCSLDLFEGIALGGVGSNCWSSRTSLLSGVLLKQMMIITGESCFDLAHHIDGLSPWASPLFIVLICLLHEHECLQLVLDTFSSLDQCTRWNLAVRAHFLESQDERLILPLDAPKSCHSANCSYLGLEHFDLLLLVHNLRKTPLQQLVYLGSNFLCWLLVKTLTFCISIVNLIVLRQESIKHF